MIPAEVAEVNAVAAARYLVAMTSPVRSYLNGRGISDATILKFKLGEVDGSFPEHSDALGRISVPYVTRLGGIQGFKFRRPNDESEQSKYISNNMPTRLYNVLAFEEAEQLGLIAVTEGESDCWTLDGECGIPTVGIPGADTWKAHPEWKLLFDGFGKVLFFADPDEPGDKLKSQVLRDLDNAYSIALDGKHDVNEYFKLNGREAVRAAAGV